jgi:SAM-dependent methyltransferase
MESMSRAFDLIGAQHNQADRPGQVAATAWVAEHAHGERVVLDVGCGNGLPTARMLADAGCGVVGVDSSPARLEPARRNVPEGIFVQREVHDLAGLHPRQGRFDAVCAFFSLAMLDRAGLAKALDSIRAVLAAAGIFAIGMVEGDDTREWPPGTGHPRRELTGLLAHHGFTVIGLTAETSAEQTRLYARCRVTPVM